MDFLFKKVGCTSLFDDNGNRVCVTLLSYIPLVVVRIVKCSDSLSRVTVGFVGSRSSSKKPQRDSYSFEAPVDTFFTFLVPSNLSIDLGSSLDINYFKVGSKVDVVGKSIGKGFCGVMKRHNFAGLRASHGVSVSHRSHGSTGQCQDPGKVFKGKKMAGRHGGMRVTVKNLRVMFVDQECLAISGAIPGSKNSNVLVRNATGWRSKKDVR